MTPEGKVKVLIDRAIQKLKDDGVAIYKHKPVQNGMGAPTLDYIGCCNGRYFAIEAKAPGGEPTKRQDATMAEIRDAGGRTFVVDGPSSLFDFVEWASQPC